MEDPGSLLVFLYPPVEPTEDAKDSDLARLLFFRRSRQEGFRAGSNVAAWPLLYMESGIGPRLTVVPIRLPLVSVRETKH